MSVTLEDFEVRYENIRKEHPNTKTCSTVGCDNPVDVTYHWSQSTSCAYHRLLFDYWGYEVLSGDNLHYYMTNQRARRTAFAKWCNELGKEVCDEIVLKLAQEPINWVC